MKKDTPRTLTFYGASDDLCEIEGSDQASGEPDEFSPDRSDIGQVRVAGVGKCPTCDQPTQSKVGILVTWHYTLAGTWSIGVAPADEDGGIPAWPMRWSHKGYTTVLEMDVPAGTVVTRLATEVVS